MSVNMNINMPPNGSGASSANGGLHQRLPPQGSPSNGVRPLHWQRHSSTYVDLMDQQGIRDSCLNAVTVGDVKPNQTVFFLDLTAQGYPISDVQSLHVSFPSTLLRRPRTTFQQLVSTLHIETQALLKDYLSSSDHIIIFDDQSTLHRCNQQTCSTILKLLSYLKEQHPAFSISLLEGGVASYSKQGPFPHSPVNVPCFKINRADEQKCKKNHPSLRLHIPPINDNKNGLNSLPSSSTKMFIQSLKKDSIHYSPNSIKKYFIFHTPEELPKHIPKWLLPYNKNDPDVLERIFEDFETLEALEVQRLEKCLMASTSTSSTSSSWGNTNTSDQKKNSVQVPEKRSRIKDCKKDYSLRCLQREYKPHTHVVDSDDDVLLSNRTNGCADEKIRRAIKEELNDSSKQNLIGKLNTVSPELLPVLNKENETNSNKSMSGMDLFKISSNKSSTTGSDVDDDIAETPLGNYQMTKGIQSFTKNRYSNILPYEHSRVRLQPSPISEPSNSNKDQEILLSESITDGTNEDTSSQEIATVTDVTQPENSVGYFSQQSSPTRVNSSSAYEKTHLSLPNTDPVSEPFNDYFNANYLRLPEINPDFNYIATQAPLASTIDDFWKVVLSNNLKVIISLNSYDELEMKKWDIYWKSQSIRKHEVKIIHTYEDVFAIPGCILRVMDVSKSDAKPRDEEDQTVSNSHRVYQVQYTKWLDSFGINMKDFIRIYHVKNLLLNDPDALIEALDNNTPDFLQTYRKLELGSVNRNSSGSPVMVHCSAGCGRTGVFITLDFLLGVLDPRSNESNKIDVWNMSPDLIFIVVNELRKQRISMVQNLTQYLTCYESMLEYFYLKEHF